MAGVGVFSFFALTFLCFGLLTAALFIGLPVIFFTFILRGDYLWNKTVYAEDYADWNNSQVCTNCGYGPAVPD